MTTDDMRLVQEYARHGSEQAFAMLVSRHTNLVYSAALRQARDPQLAQEITQVVFVLLARKASALGPDTILPGWLYRTAGYVSSSALKQERRRLHREQKAYMQSELDAQKDPTWDELSPLLDEAMLHLGQTDRDALVLRYFEGRSLQEVGSVLGASEDAAKKRVSRALEKLRKHFATRGVASTTGAIGETISAHSVLTAPSGLVETATAMALAKGAAASTSTLTLIKGALKVMAWAKAKTAVVAGVGILFIAGTTTITVKEIAAGKDEGLWRTPNFGPNVFEKVAPQVTILPTKYPNNRTGQDASGNRWLGIDQQITTIVSYAYDWPYGRVVFDSGDPKKAYDMIANLPQGAPQALQRELRNKLGLKGRFETRDTDAFVLIVSRPNARGLKPPSGRGYSDPWGHFSSRNGTIGSAHPSEFGLVMELELLFGKPVIDRTGLTQRFNIDLTWNGDLDSLKQALQDQLGLELIPTNAPVEMLVVEKAQ